MDQSILERIVKEARFDAFGECHKTLANKISKDHALVELVRKIEKQYLSQEKHFQDKVIIERIEKLLEPYTIKTVEPAKPLPVQLPKRVASILPIVRFR